MPDMHHKLLLTFYHLSPDLSISALSRQELCVLTSACWYVLLPFIVSSYLALLKVAEAYEKRDDRTHVDERGGLCANIFSQSPGTSIMRRARRISRRAPRCRT